ncbi:hypothetical protein FRACYDRAFT_250104 [Fragilariopsis cylindrus CCMP1102]|uniref:Bulb-type lectin domain-containing protein n=1 Tax=Fragilariopsis cylindrus CCMP1102 TaxID=635003 RepID=A0A1E7EQY7_9STRA|nr:hypothetical protein FRACYDRAFT_250104 [Fragilariopsis cylindrus CCMP1102]|eukprot:OEU08315.1 hypothetical protein FRACYDRAFT_250104 [Fragilariopsis cylindrus CCMP1102]
MTNRVAKRSKKRSSASNNNNNNSSASSSSSIVTATGGPDSVQYEFEWEAIEVGFLTRQKKEEPVVVTLACSDDNAEENEHVHTIHEYEYEYEHEHEHDQGSMNTSTPTKSSGDVLLRKVLSICIVILVILLIPVVTLLLMRRPPDNNVWTPPDYDFEFAPRTLVLNSGESIIASDLKKSPMNFVSPSGLYQLSLNQNGDLTIRSRKIINLNTTTSDANIVTSNWSDILWQKDGFPDNGVYTTTTSVDGNGDTTEIKKRNIKLSMQVDGNFVLRDTSAGEGITIWKSLTRQNPNAYFVFDDSGQIKVIDATTGYPLYLDGIPTKLSVQSNTNDDDDDDGKSTKNTDIATTTTSNIAGRGNLGPYPVRGIFYYPWFPTTWRSSDGNHLAHYIPKLGQYDSSHYDTIVNHVEQLDYGKIQLGISSWWGPDTKSDKARLLLMMDASWQKTEGRLKWCIYFEPQQGDDTVEGIRSKLKYLQEWFVDHPSYGRTIEDNKPVVFVYNKNSKDGTDCQKTSKLWSEANAPNNEWHIVLKLFNNAGFVNISPGFFHAKEEVPRLERLTSTEWTESVQKMSSLRDDDSNSDNIKWHLITSFNEAVEGTIIEATDEWDTKSGMGYFLDALHNN